MTWWRFGVLYQIYPRSFADSDGDGVGDLAGIIAHLDHLRGSPRSLGVDGLWLSPIYPSPQADYGYDISDHCAVDPLYGDLATFDRLVAEAHARDLRVLLDLVPGHTSAEHPWFREARMSRAAPRREWYIWADPAPDGRPPNNWESAFGGPAWTLDEATEQYYLHSFYPEQPDLNWRNPAVRRALGEVTAFWLARGVDGFRVDAIDRSMKDPLLRDNPAGVGVAAGVPLSPGGQLPLWNKGRPETLDVVRALRQAADVARPGTLLLGEAYVPVDRLGRYLGERAGEAFDLAFDFDFLLSPWDADRLRLAVEGSEAHLPPHAWACRAFSNHDNPRHATRYGAAVNRAAALLLLTLRGTPVLYMGEEIGMEDVRLPGDARDRAGRDSQRTPMQWQDIPGGGFTAGQPWLPVGDTSAANVAAQRDDPGSLLAFYRRLIAERHSSEALGSGTQRMLDTARGDGVVAFLRESEGERLLVVVSCAGRGATVDLVAAARGRIPPEGRVRVSTDGDRSDAERVSVASLALAPNEGLIVEL